MHQKGMCFSRFCRKCCSSDSETMAQMLARFAFGSKAQMSHYDRNVGSGTAELAHSPRSCRDGEI